MRYLDFDLEIGVGTEGTYPVKVLRSPAGEAEGRMRFPFDTQTLENRLLKLQNALLRSGGEQRRRISSDEEQAVQEFGERLFEALLMGDLRSRYDVSRERAAQERKGLRLRMRIQAPELAALPWEYLYDQTEGEYVCLSSKTPLVRYLELPHAAPPLKIEPPLRILGMIANPSDQDQLNVERERERMRQALSRLEGKGLVKLTWLEGQTWQDVHRAMQRGPWHVFHFIGHGGFNPRTDEGVLALANEEGQTRLLGATELGRLLANHLSLRLVILNACEGARGSERDVFSSSAAMLARRGIPAVLAMQYEITDKAAIECTRAFYEALASGNPVDEAVSQARTAISVAMSSSLEWGTPVLYLRAADGVLFDLPPQTLTLGAPPVLAVPIQDAAPLALPRAPSARSEVPARQSSSPTPPTPAYGASHSPARPIPADGEPLVVPPVFPPVPALPFHPPTLLILSIAGSTPLRRVPLQARGLTVGREVGNDLVITDPTVSRYHLRITWQEGSWQVTRQPGTGILYVNGRLQDQAEVHPGDQLVIGGTVLRLEPADAQAGITNLGSEEAPLLLTTEPVPHLTVDWPGGRFVAPLRDGSITIGRAPESALVIPAPAISVHHAVLSRASDGGYSIQDAGSRNGLTFQGTRVQQHRLQHGDRFIIGSPAEDQFVILAYAMPRR
jgi:pSer/pThr/pTyr-binding forkhead associated (FHA) protein